jgi:predicted metal-dependent TIM-barrel fold hydrolase
MRIFDPHIHMTSRTTDDYEAMAAAGVRALVEPAFWLGQPRTSVGSFVDYFDGLLGWEPFRAAQFGLAHHCAVALNPKEANDPRLTGVLGILPRYLEKDRVVAVGEIGYDSMTPEEDRAFAAQLQLAIEHDLPVLVHTPHRDKLAGTRRTLAVLRESGIEPGRVLIDHLNELTVELAAGSGCWMGFSIYPRTKMSEDRMVRVLARYGTARMLVNSAADWGRSDPLKTRRTADAMVRSGFSAEAVDAVFWRNPVEFYGQSGRLELNGTGQEPALDFAGNSVKRGEEVASCDSGIVTAPPSTLPIAPMSMLRRTWRGWWPSSPGIASLCASASEQAGSELGSGWPPMSLPG